MKNKILNLINPKLLTSHTPSGVLICFALELEKIKFEESIKKRLDAVAMRVLNRSPPGRIASGNQVDGNAKDSWQAKTANSRNF